MVRFWIGWRMAKDAAVGLWRFVGEEELTAGIVPDDWGDLAPLNEEGRGKMI